MKETNKKKLRGKQGTFYKLLTLKAVTTVSYDFFSKKSVCRAKEINDIITLKPLMLISACRTTV